MMTDDERELLRNSVFEQQELKEIKKREGIFISM
jgi:hypothetical protein